MKYKCQNCSDGPCTLSFESEKEEHLTEECPRCCGQCCEWKLVEEPKFNPDDENQMLYFGKYHCFNEDDPKPNARKVWIGPMTEKEMKQDFCEFRHNGTSAPPLTEETRRI